MTTPTPTAPSDELQAIEARQLQADISALKEMQALTEFSYQNSAIQRAIAALSQSSEAQRAVEAIAALELIMKTWKSYPQDNWDIQFERDCLPSVKAVLSQLPRPT